MVPKSAKCDRTGKLIKLSEGFLAADTSTGEWSFVCSDAPEIHGEYATQITRLILSPEVLVDWMAHLNEKSWFSAQKFLDFFTRFRKENNLFGAI